MLDLTERKRAEAEARESERRYREVQMELAHANRVATMGQLTASIAHEVNQPIAAAVTNARRRCAGWRAKPPNLEEVRQALERIVRDANRAGDVIGRIRDAHQKERRRERSGVDINEAIREVIELTRSEAVKNGVLGRRRTSRAACRSSKAIGSSCSKSSSISWSTPSKQWREVAEGRASCSSATAQAEPRGVLVAVRDSGPGLAPGSLEHLFDAILHDQTRRPGHGTVDLPFDHRSSSGTLVGNANQPRGAIFHFTVPVHRPNANSPA